MALTLRMFRVGARRCANQFNSNNHAASVKKPPGGNIITVHG